MNTSRYARLTWWGTVAIAGLLAGCGRDNVARVSGTVTLDGQPLDGAVVQFQPIAGNIPSTGVTNSSGEYTLRYTRDTDGAEIGEHTVSISTSSRGNPDADPPKPAVKERLPAKYNTRSELKKTVEAGSNTIDFPLESGGQTATSKP